jgi:hypothetical protein
MFSGHKTLFRWGFEAGLMGFKTLPLGHKIGFIAALTTLIGGVWPLATAVDFPLAAWG